MTIQTGPRLRLLAVAFCAASVTTCDDSGDLTFPSAPTALTSGITVYDGTHFTGGSAHVDRDVEDLTKYQGPCSYTPPDESPVIRAWENCISSIRVADGVRAVIFVDTGLKGFAVTIDRDVADLGLIVGPCRNGSMDNCVSSIRVRLP